jgi:hypothetical protein
MTLARWVAVVSWLVEKGIARHASSPWNMLASVKVTYTGMSLEGLPDRCAEAAHQCEHMLLWMLLLQPRFMMVYDESGRLALEAVCHL